MRPFVLLLILVLSPAWAADQDLKFTDLEIQTALCVAKIPQPNDKSGPDFRMKLLVAQIEAGTTASKVALGGDAIGHNCVNIKQELWPQYPSCGLVSKINKNPTGFISGVTTGLEFFKTNQYLGQVEAIMGAKAGLAGIDEQQLAVRKDKIKALWKDSGKSPSEIESLADVTARAELAEENRTATLANQNKIYEDLKALREKCYKKEPLQKVILPDPTNGGGAG